MSADPLKAAEDVTSADDDGRALLRALLNLSDEDDPAAWGFLSIPNAFRAVAREQLTPNQRLVLYEMMGEANYEPKPPVRLADGRLARVGIGEALVSERGFAAKYRLGKGSMGKSRVRSAIRAARRLGLISTRPAAPSSEPAPAPRLEPPPTIVRFNVLRAIAWPRVKDEPGFAPLTAPSNGPIQPLNPVTSTPDASASACGERSKSGALPACVKDLKVRLEARIGRQLSVPTEPAERRETIAKLEAWIEAEGIDEVEEACYAKACRMAAKGGLPISLLLFARYSDEISDQATWDNPSFGAKEKNPRWRAVLDRMTPAQNARLKTETSDLWSRFPGDKANTPEAQREWGALLQHCESEVGIR